MWKIIVLFVCVFYINYVEPSYNPGIKTKAYHQQEPTTQVYAQPTYYPANTPINSQYNQHASNNNDNNYQTTVRQHYSHDDNSDEQPQYENDYYQQNPTKLDHRLDQHNHQSEVKPIYERIQTTGNWHDSENSINQYYTGCPEGHTGPLPYEYDCRRFLNCWHGRGHIQSCSVGTVFNPETLECDSPHKVKCEAASNIVGVQSGDKSYKHENYKLPLELNYKGGQYVDKTTDIVDVLCPTGSKGLQPHPSDCTRFINCDNGNIHVQQCGPGTAYSVYMKVCDFINKVDCTGRQDHLAGHPRQDQQTVPETPLPLTNTDLPHTADLLCLNGLTGLFPHPFDYTKFIFCKNGNTAIQNCQAGTVFSISKRYCAPKNDIQTSDHVMYMVSQVSYEYAQTLISCPPGTEGVHLYPFNAELYVQCVKSQMHVIPCNNVHVFSTTRHSCLPLAQVLKTERVRLLSELNTNTNRYLAGENYRIEHVVHCPAGVTGNYPHPFDSTKYLKCVGGHLTSESCGSGQVYSLSRKICSLKEEIIHNDYVGPVKPSYGHAQSIIGMELTYSSVDGLTYLLCPVGWQGYFLHPFDCTKYIECSHGTTAIDNCLNGAVFSISRKECIPRDKVQAYDRVEYMPTITNEFSKEQNVQNQGDLGVTCTVITSGVYPYPNDYHKYIRCANGRLSVESCGAGQVFNAQESYCLNENHVDNSDRSSYNRVLSESQTPYKGAIKTPNIAYPGGSHTTVAEIQQPSDSPTFTAVLPSSTPSLTHVNTGKLDDVSCPPKNNGYYPHPLDCTKFLVCANGITYVRECGPGTAWNNEMKVCDFKAKLNCVTAGNNLPTTTEYNNNAGSQQHDNSAVRKATENRWTGMNLPRPQSPEYGQPTTWQQTSDAYDTPTKVDLTSTWSGTAVQGDQTKPTHTIIYEEGSLEPNRNYKRPMYNTPLAPLKPTTTTTTSTVVYAQPVSSQEDSSEIFSNAPPKTTNPYNPRQPFPASNRQDHTRHLNTWTPIQSHPGQGTLYRNNPVPKPVTSHLEPPLPLPAYRPQDQTPVTHLMPPYRNEDLGQKPVPESDFRITPINIDRLPGQIVYDLDDFDQQPANSFTHNTNIGPNLNSHLQPPSPNFKPATTPTKKFSNTYQETTQIPLPPKITPTTHRISVYPQLSNATIQTFPNQPHYSYPYAEVAHSHNATWMARKIPQHSAIKNTNVKATGTSLPQYNGVDAPPHFNNEQDEVNQNPGDQEATMKAALKLLLKPYLDSESVINVKVAENGQSHIMKLSPSSNKEAIASTTTHTPYFYENPIVTSTTPHQGDAELILAGEQHHLAGVASTQTRNHETSTSYSLYQTPLAPERTTLRQSSTYTHDHKNNWPKHDPHAPHHLKFQHSREFHKKHPHLPNPFDNSPNPHPELTTPKTYDIDLRVGDECPFECGNGKCIEQHQVCDGVNNCGNRNDEQDCGHLGYQVRLTGGQSSNTGRVEVKILGKWGYVCDDKFGLRDADVVCRELGFKMGALEVRGSSHYAPSDENVYFAMDEVQCTGNETSLRECEFKGWGVNNCGPDEVVGVVCKVPKLKCPDNYWLCSTSKECIPTAFLCDLTPDCEDGSDESEAVCNAPINYRLEGGRSSSEGRLEVFYHGEWGTVCDDDFGLKEAQVLCNSLGLYGKAEIVKNIYGPGSGPIWLDQVSCLGTETKIHECNHWSWGENNCNHTEDVGLKCTAGPKPNPHETNKPLTGNNLNQNTDSNSDPQFEQGELDDLGLYQGLWQRSSKAIPSQKKCGQFKSNLFDEYEHPEERVVNGSVAKRGRHPWQATIRTRGRGGISSHWCGAVIISRKLILTAAHCLAGYPKGSYFVRMGDHYATIAESSEVESNIENWYIHEKFRDQKHMNNDIALILLKNPLRFNDYVQPVCLPEKGATLEANRLCTISGWGSIKSGTSTPSNILRSAQVPILADEVCRQKNVYANAMTEGMFCAGFLDESADACDGDSGGPLVCSDEDGETLYGIISWGQHCGYANHPGVYVRVERYIDWIYDKINLMMQQGKL